MFRIGEFSCFSRVSVKMLRHYDEIGLLTPAHTDASSGYRYYTADQLPRLNQIILLKDLGFGLEQIAQLLDAALSPSALRGALAIKRAEIEAEITTLEQRLSRLDHAWQQLQMHDRLPRHAIIVREVPAQLIASIRRAVDPSAITDLFETLEAVVARHQARQFSPPLMLFHDTEFREELRDIEVAVPVKMPFADDSVQVGELPGGLMACVVYMGEYGSTDLLLQQFPAWLEANGYQAAGPLREVYLRFGAQNTGYTLPESYLTDTAAAYVTELQLPIRAVNDPSSKIESS